MIQIKRVLTGAVLLEVDSLRSADLRSADLQGADLSGANLRYADLGSADLRNADLQGADLSGANLYCADLRDANLSDANLSDANLYGANLLYAKIDEKTIQPHFQICPTQGAFIAWKKTATGVIKILVPEDARRTSSMISRRCRASHVVVLDGPGADGASLFNNTVIYSKGAVVTADWFDADPKVECTYGIHFFMTKKEAEEY